MVSSLPLRGDPAWRRRRAGPDLREPRGTSAGAGQAWRRGRARERPHTARVPSPQTPATDSPDHDDATPYWRQSKPGESRFPALVAVLVAVVLQLLLPHRLQPGPTSVLPPLEVLLLAVLVVADPVRLEREHPLLRAASLALTG